ncbi:Uncharacterised protein [Candidatus Bilamarchaeum dharawalense]|uniref:Uncharacterized protein n=1 Tax=Candidatus Bilamarchaeum dharawalense TaxID=2885759 RepID=A0A5E4LS84_9ARCH|nr:Uncharacterised protein [Candidatus Bilamarchaeum dharawalense]
MVPNDRRTVQRVLRAHESAVKGFTDDFRAAVLSDQLSATREMRTATATRMWVFAPVRIAMSEEIGALALSFNTDQVPKDFPLRIARLSLAMYFLDVVEAMQARTAQTNTPAMSALFQSASQAIQRILDPTYFTKSNEQIIRDYLDAEPIILACATACSVKLKTLEQAVREYKMIVAEEIDAILPRS